MDAQVSGILKHLLVLAWYHQRGHATGFRWRAVKKTNS
jgi:hypothetical protein